MIILTDNIAFAQNCIPARADWYEFNISSLDSPEQKLASELFDVRKIQRAVIPGFGHWDYLLAVNQAQKSQYDVLAGLASAGLELPGRVLCCAGSGERFHGFKGRSWKARPGNIHLSAYVEPKMVITGGSAGFIVAAVIAVMRAIETVDLEGRKPVIKWVNDVLVQDAKVAGVLARLQTQREIVKCAIVGIGLNVEQRPDVERDPYVPDVASLADFARDPGKCRHVNVFPHLMQYLGANLEQLYQGQFQELLEVYRKRSLILNRHITVREEGREAAMQVIAEGKVKSIGPELELYIEGCPRPVTKGRLTLG